MDGIPYEFWHHGVNFISTFVALIVYQTAGSEDRLDEILGPAVDLLAWIPKTPGACSPDELRPLQLPTTLRRLVGATIADLLGPAIARIRLPGKAARAPQISGRSTPTSLESGTNREAHRTWVSLAWC